MSKYVKLEDVKELIRTEWVKYMPIELDMNVSFVLGKMAELPTIDITLCEECECSDISEETGITRCCKFEFFNDPKGGCSYSDGERKEQ